MTTSPDTQPGGDRDGVWVASWALPKGRGYGVRLRVDATTWTLGPDAALAYAAAVVRAATTAEHDAAVFGLLTTRLGLPTSTAATVIGQDLRPDRTDTDAITHPLQLRPGLAASPEVMRGEAQPIPMVGLHIGGEQVGQFTPADARHHATGVLSTIAAADLDAAFRRLLVGPINLDEGRASAVIASLDNHWPTPEEPRHAD